MPGKHHSPQSPSRRHRQRTGRKRNLTPLWIGIAVVVVLAAALIFLRPGSTVPNEVTAAQAYQKYRAGALFVDVRTQEEWNQGHIAKSLLIPLDELPNRLNELPKDRDLVVVCHSGVRAKEGATILRNAGFTRVSCLSGGLQAWVDAGYPIEQ
jgi:rhodanese-related sulfurtransferase